MPIVRSLVIVSSTAAAAVLTLAGPASAATTSTVTASAASDYFNGDSCVPGTSFCIAVGANTAGTHSRGLSEVLSGGSWAANPVPSPSVKPNIFGNEVSCASMTQCVFVGQHYGAAMASSANLAEAWNGKVWKIITAQGPRGTTSSGLTDVACPTSHFCMAVGVANVGRPYHATAYTWTNGRTWKQLAVPAPHRSNRAELSGLACASATDCMAIGDYQNTAGTFLPDAAKWHKGSWRVLAVPGVRGLSNDFMQGASCPSASLCVAVGDAAPASSEHAFADVYSGGTWRVAAVWAAHTALFGVSCPTTKFCKAAGFGGGSALIGSWNGTTWTGQYGVQTTGTYPFDEFAHMSCVSTTHCEAVGFQYNRTGGEHTLAEVWNGTSWAIQPTRNP